MSAADATVHCAYDTSIDDDWVARYAIRLAAGGTERALRVLHVRDPGVAPDRLEEKLAWTMAQAAAAGVECEPRVLPAGDGVAAALARAVTPRPGAILVCGTRARFGIRGLLRGTVSEALLRRARCGVVAARVVQPGLLGAPHRIVVPLPREHADRRLLAPVLARLAGGLRELHLLRVLRVRRAVRARLAAVELAALRARARREVDAVEADLVAHAALGDTGLDGFVRISEDWVRETLVHASQHRSQLACVALDARDLPGRLSLGGALERLLHDSPCDVALLRAAAP